MMNKKLYLRLVSIVFILAGAFGLYGLEYYWLTDKTYRVTVDTLGSRGDVIQSWVIVGGSVVSAVVGLIMFTVSFRHKSSKK